MVVFWGSPGDGEDGGGFGYTSQMSFFVKVVFERVKMMLWKIYILILSHISVLLLCSCSPVQWERSKFITRHF